jgi:hypothetical protein
VNAEDVPVAKNSNSWNRLNIALRTVPGAYQPAQQPQKKIQEIKKPA